MDRRTAIKAGLKRYAGGTVCPKHPGAERYSYNGACHGCVKASSRRRRNESKADIIKHYSGSKNCCAGCGISDLEVLTVDHIKQDGAAHRRTNGINGMAGRVNRGGKQLYKWLIKNNYPSGFRVLCFNCNIKAWLKYQRDNLI